MNHKAIRALYSNVVNIDDSTGAFDAQGNQVEINLALVDAWVDPNEYKTKRLNEYPSIGDQLDALFHAGVFPSDMAEQIQAIKDKYPKA